jgi:hypothetical protein
MAVYVDDMRAPLGDFIMCHMLADTIEELHAMADCIGMPRGACQHEHLGQGWVHYDISLARRALAVRAGAIEITWRQAGQLCYRWRQARRLVTGR